MLGDGRAVLVGEQITSDGGRFDVQLKGSGRTPYSRNGDGRAALAPMLREYLISEAMHALGIPTTRSLAVVATGESVMRERELDGAVLTRVATSHIRIGTFEYALHFGGTEALRSLADYTIERHFGHILQCENKYLIMLKEVIERQAFLISKWQTVGFVHGVMNTDNMAIGGETIDYGPCAFMDVFNPATVFSSIDTHGRYSYENQPKMAAWNLARFAETLLPLLHDNENDAVSLAQKELALFQNLYQKHWLTAMRAKLGLFNEEAEDELLINNLLKLMKDFKADFTNTFCALTLNRKCDGLFLKPEFCNWNGQWQARLGRQQKTKEEVAMLMKNNNPAVIARNHLVEKALNAAENGNLDDVKKLISILSNPYDYTSEQTECSLHAPAPYRYKTFCGT
jgi:uncharacterized protein YdiU (UPF0061 family)